MGSSPGFDWPAYFRGLGDEETHALATWLAAAGLGVGEFMEVVDRAHAAASPRERRPPEGFLAGFGRPAAAAYARRKWRFAGLLAALELALMSGAFRGEIVPAELEPCPPPRAGRRRADELLRALERAMSGRA